MAKTNEPGESKGANDEQQAESGRPGGGQGRRNEVGGSGVHPASAGNAPDDAEIRPSAARGQSQPGAEGSQDAGGSEPEERKWGRGTYGAGGLGGERMGERHERNKQSEVERDR